MIAALRPRAVVPVASSRVSPDEVDDWGFDGFDLPAPATAAARRPSPPPREPQEPAIEEPGDQWALAAQPVPPDDVVAPESEPAQADDTPPSARRGVARNTAIFSIFTGASRIVGLVREIVAAYFFATSGRISAFTIAFQVPNLVRGLFADAALSAAFVPVFTGLLEQRRKREAYELASTLLVLIVFALGAITLFFILAAGVIMPLFTGDKFSHELTELTVGLSRVLFPVVVLLGINGLVVGILNAHEHFSIPAIAPLVWNVVIIVGLIVLKPLFSGVNDIYAYAIAVLAGTVVQLLMSLPVLKTVGFRFAPSFNFRDPRIKQVLTLMLPVTIGLGVINFDLVINSGLGSLVSDQAPRAIDAAFRIYMLPQGMFSVAVATVLFPALSRYAARRDIDGLRATMATGVRQIFLLLVPSAAFTLVLATPIVRLIYQHGSFGSSSTHQVAVALFWFSFSLPFAGANLLLTRTFFSVQRPWFPTATAAANLVVNGVISLALYKPLGIAGLVIGTAVASLGMTIGQAWVLRGVLGGRIEGTRTLATVVAISVASAVLALVAWLVWAGVDAELGRSIPGQLMSVGLAAVAGGAVYLASVRWLGIAEFFQIERLVLSRVRSRAL
jgi:putative peptidoglycan lipid II flippase